MDEQKKLQEIIQASNTIVFLGGAGVSTESGIPDFRSESGIYQTLEAYGQRPETLLSRSFFDHDPQTFYSFFRTMIYLNAQPNEAHKALALLEQQGKLKAVITQNIDGLHQKAGSREVLELHGSVLRHNCMVCKRKYSVDQVIKQMGEKEVATIPRCSYCGGIIKPDVVLYEEPLNSAILEEAVRRIAQADVLIVGGTSLVVYPAAGLIDYFEGKELVLINKSETPQDRFASLVIHRPIGEVLGKAVLG